MCPSSNGFAPDLFYLQLLEQQKSDVNGDLNNAFTPRRASLVDGSRLDCQSPMSVEDVTDQTPRRMYLTRYGRPLIAHGPRANYSPAKMQSGGAGGDDDQRPPRQHSEGRTSTGRKKRKDASAAEAEGAAAPAQEQEQQQQKEQKQEQSKEGEGEGEGEGAGEGEKSSGEKATPSKRQVQRKKVQKYADVAKQRKKDKTVAKKAARRSARKQD